MAQQIFTTPGADSFPVPAGVTSITIKAFGPGGGSGASDDALANAFGERGGGGGFAKGTITVTPLETLTLHIGGKGLGGTWVSTGAGGGGGGRSSVYRGATPLIIAGGGGGGGGGDNSNAASGVGGVGGGATGGAGGDAGTATGGGGGTTSAGGALGTGGSDGTAGGALSGGNGGNSGAATGNGGEANGGTTDGGDGGSIVTANFAGGGGGGSGRYGGGGGGGSVAGSAGGGGGGGGSNYVSGTDTTSTQAVGAVGAGQGDPDYQAGTGDGGAKLSSLSTDGNDGEDGAIVISWSSDVIASVGKSVDSWCGAIPVYLDQGVIDEEVYQYCRAKVVTPAAETFYVPMTWHSGNDRFEGVIYPGSNLGNGCADPTTGSFTVTVQLSDTADFTPVDYSGGTSFTTYITRRKTSKGTAYDYCDPVPTWDTDHWEWSISDFVIYADQARSNCAIAIPFLPSTASISNITVKFDTVAVSGGSAESTSNAWWWNSTSHTLYLQVASITTTEVDVDITFDSDTDLWATRFDRVNTGDIGTRLFYNGLFIANQYLTTSVYGGGHNQTGMQAETRAHRPGNDDITTDCMERAAVHVDDTIRTDASGSYASNIKWADTWQTFLIHEDNDQLVVEVSSSPTNWQQQVITGISCKRTQVFKSGVPYIRNVYEFTNNDSSSHDYPFVWQREQWLGTDRETNDRGRYADASSDAAVDAEEQIISLNYPYIFAYDDTAFATTGVIFQNLDSSTYGVFTADAFIIAGSPYAIWPVPIADWSTTVAENFGFYHKWLSVPAGGKVTIAFLHFNYYGTSLADVQSEISGISVNYKLEGVTKDKTGSVLGICDCHLYKMNPDGNGAVWMAFDESDSSGNYSFTGLWDDDARYFVIAYKDNTPHVMDGTDHVLVPVEE